MRYLTKTMPLRIIVLPMTSLSNLIPMMSSSARRCLPPSMQYTLQMPPSGPCTPPTSTGTLTAAVPPKGYPHLCLPKSYSKAHIDPPRSTTHQLPRRIRDSSTTKSIRKILLTNMASTTDGLLTCLCTTPWWNWQASTITILYTRSSTIITLTTTLLIGWRKRSADSTH